MTAVSFAMMKTNETPEWVAYAFGSPARVIGHVILSKTDGKIELQDVADEKYRRLLPYIKRALSQHYQVGDYPDRIYYNA